MSALRRSTSRTSHKLLNVDIYSHISLYIVVESASILEQTPRLARTARVTYGDAMSSPSLREFIEQREAEIRQLRAELLKELRELRAAKSAIAQSVGKDEKATLPTIKTMIRKVLEKRNRAASADEIISWIHEDFGAVIARTSVSPQLSRLRADEILTLDEATREWALIQSVASLAEDMPDQESRSEATIGGPDETAID